jgi:hypothetical protein
MIMRSTNCDSYCESARLQACGALEFEEAGRLETHLAACADCRRYADELRVATSGLRWLSTREVEPSPGFRARWTQAVAGTARPRGFVEIAAELGERWRELLLRNLRPALGVASLWLLTLLFRLGAPDVSSASPTTAARSPVEIARALEADQRLVAWHLGRFDPLPPARRPAQPVQPRSERFPARPAAQSDLLPDAHADLESPLPKLLAHREFVAPLPLWTT